MAILDISIVNIAIPTIQHELQLDTASLQWIVTGYVLTFGGFLLVGGRLGDLYGRRRMLLTGLVIFVVSSALGGLSKDLTMLLLARAGQGFGGAIVTPTVVSFITGLFEEGPARNRALGLLGAVTGAGFALGLILGGLLTSTVGWRWVFFINLPIGIAVAVGAVLLLPVTRPEGVHVNIVSAVLATSGLASVVYVLSSLAENSLGATVIGTVIAAALLYGFVVAERRSDHPLVPPGLIRHPQLGRALVGSTSFGILVNPTTFILTLFLQNVSKMSPLTTGLAFLPQEVTVFTAANVAGGFVSRYGTKRVLAGSIAVLATGSLIFTGLPLDGTYTNVVLPGLLVFGFGLGALNVAGAISATEGLPKEQHGVAAGIWNTGTQIGTAVGLPLLMSFATFRTHSLLQSAQDSGGAAGGTGAGSAGGIGMIVNGVDETVMTAATVSGFRLAFAVAIVIALLGVVGVHVVGRSKNSSDVVTES